MEWKRAVRYVEIDRATARQVKSLSDIERAIKNAGLFTDTYLVKVIDPYTETVRFTQELIITDNGDEYALVKKGVKE